MSAAPGLEPVAPRVRARRRPPLALVPPARPAARGAVRRSPFVAVVVSLLGAGLLGLLVLNTALAQDAFRLHTLKQESRALEDREEALRREVAALQSPQELAGRAAELGMVPAGPPAFLRLSDGAVLGATTPAEAPVDGEAAAEAPATAEEAPVETAEETPADETPAGETPAEAPSDGEGEGQ
jgi:hypothetical protein